MVEKSCPAKPEPDLYPVVFHICGPDECVTETDPEVLKELDCRQCLDTENAANLFHNVGALWDWIEDDINRCHSQDQ